MSLVPSKLVDRISFYEDHHANFSANAAAIGLLPADVTALQTKTTAARAKLTDQSQAKIDAKSATTDLRVAAGDMSNFGSDLIKKIRAKAATDGDGVWALAGLPTPAIPGPVPPPGTPTDFKAVLQPDGSLKIRWKCANPPGAAGTIYQIGRSTGGGAGAGFPIIASTGLRSFLDGTVPAAPMVTYQIQAVRSTLRGAANQFTVKLGVGGSGEMTATVLATPKLAA